jgi:hypothetical protein
VLPRRWYGARTRFRDALRAYWRDLEASRWFAQYDAYLRTPEWLAKRRLVLHRDGGQCQAQLDGCLQAASEVHHLSYAHWRNEPLWELQSVCHWCHEQITSLDRASRGAIA